MTLLTRRSKSDPAPGRNREVLSFHHLGSIKMYSMHEALARDRMREHERQSRQVRLMREMSAERRRHRVSLQSRSQHSHRSRHR
jgi:hypothetical protein